MWYFVLLLTLYAEYTLFSFYKTINSECHKIYVSPMSKRSFRKAVGTEIPV